MVSKEASPGYRTEPFPRMRQLVLDAGWLSRRRAMIHGFAELDITEARQLIAQRAAASGERLSFTAFLAACIGQAVEQDPYVQAMRDWRNRLVIFDDVDVLVTVEIQANKRTFPLIHPLRAVNRREVADIHAEIRAVQAKPAESAGARGPLQRYFYRLPTPIRRLVYRIISGNPHQLRQFAGTVGLTSVGMFFRASGWGVGMPNHTLAITAGGIGEKPTLVDGRLAAREYLSVTMSYDHDIVDGAPAARFGRRFADLIEGAYGLT